MNAITNPIATRASTPVMAMPRYRPPMTSDWNLGCLPGTALLRAILHHEHTKRKTANRSLVNSNQATRGDRYGRNAALFSLDAGTETTALLERRTRAGHRSLKQGQLEVVGGGRRQLDSAGGPTSKGVTLNCNGATNHAAGWKGASTRRPVLTEIGHSQMQSRPANSATPMSHTGQTGPELGFSLIAWPGRRDAARPQRTAPVIAAKGEQLQ
jgi:hypothetical protein